jgi:hypothetical protein
MSGAALRALVLTGVFLAACAAPAQVAPSASVSSAAAAAPPDLVVGRVARGTRVIWLTERPHLVVIEPFTGVTSVVPVTGLLPGERPWGLAVLDGDESYWTLLSPRTLGRIGADGRVLTRLATGTPRLAVYGWRHQLLLMDPHAPPGEPVLVRVSPLAPNRSPAPFGSLLARHFARPRADVWLFNYPDCGVGWGDEIPCWFRDLAAVDLTGTDGVGRRVALEGLQDLPRDVLDGPMDTMPRVIRDAHAAADGHLWVLSYAGGEDPADGGAQRLTRHAADGALMASTRLEAPARMLLALRDAEAWLLVGSSIRTVTLR